MRAYQAADEEAILARGQLKDWAGEGLLSESQVQVLEPETECSLRRTNVFLRIVLFLFTLLIVGAVVGFVFLLFMERASTGAVGIFWLVCAGACYFAAERAVSEAKLYRYGIEEALALAAVGYLALGSAALFGGDAFLFSSSENVGRLIAALMGTVSSLWIWYRFGLAYFMLVAMGCAAVVPSYWNLPEGMRQVCLGGVYGVGLEVVMRQRGRYRYSHLERQYGIAEALLWLGVYFAMHLPTHGVWSIGRPLFWASWVLVWCLPGVALWRGIRLRDHFVIGAGLVCGLVTLATNRLYFGWPGHSWDAMVLGALLIGVALVLRRWLAAGPEEIRHGFTARRLSGKDKQWMEVATTAIGLTAETPQAPKASAQPQFGGGDSGGGGASSDW